MKLREWTLGDVFEKYLVLSCSWEKLGGAPEQYPWPAQADGVLVYLHASLHGCLAFEVLCPVVQKTETFLTELSPSKVNADGCFLERLYSTELGLVEAFVPDQQAMENLGLLNCGRYWTQSDKCCLKGVTDETPLAYFDGRC